MTGIDLETSQEQISYVKKCEMKLLFNYNKYFWNVKRMGNFI